MTTESDLRSVMVDRLVEHRIVSTTAVESAMRTVARHQFVPGIDPRLAYADEAIALKRHHGVVVSSISQPAMVASMLEMLEVEKRSKVLEIGTGSGYNAALLAELNGLQGLVVTIDVDRVLSGLAAVHLARNGYDSVEVHAADGHDGWPQAAPYDRIIVTASVETPEESWIEQLAEGGRMVVPLSREQVAVAFVKINGGLERSDSCPALFVPLR